MKCPLTSIGYLASERIEASRKCECGKEQCAWWNADDEECAVWTLVTGLAEIANQLALLKDKIPLGR